MKGSPRVLHLLESGGLYGAERVVLNLAVVQKAAGEFEPVVGCIVQHPAEPSALYDAASAAGLEAHRFLLRNGRLAIDVPRAARDLRVARISLLHSHGYKATVYGSFVRALRPMPITATCHLWFMRPDSPAKMKAMVALEMRIYRRFRAVVAVSEQIRRILVRSGVDERRVQVVRNGIPLDGSPLGADRRRTLRESLGVPSDGFLVLNAGRLSAQKDQAALVHAISAMPAGNRPVFCAIAGEGPLRGELQDLIGGAGLGGRVRLIGYRDDVGDLLGAADAFALPSLDEGMPMILLEAAAAGLALVATPVGDVPELVRDGVTGLLVPCGEPAALAAALTRLRDEAGLAGRLGAAVREDVRRSHSRESMAARYAEVYRELIHAS